MPLAEGEPADFSKARLTVEAGRLARSLKIRCRVFPGKAGVAEIRRFIEGRGHGVQAV